MSIHEYLKKIDTNDASTSVLQSIRDAVINTCRDYLTFVKLFSLSSDDTSKLIFNNNDGDIAHYYITTTDRLKEATKQYRTEYLKVSANYNNKGIIVQTYDKKDLMDCIASAFHWQFHSRKYKDRKMVTYTEGKFKTACVIALAFLLTKYPDAYDFQAYATITYVLMEYFDCKTVNADIIDQVDSIMSMDMSLVEGYQTKYFAHKIIKPRKKRTAEKKAKLPFYDEMKRYIDSGRYTRAELEKIIAEQYHVSARTVRRHIADLGLARNYKTSK